MTSPDFPSISGWLGFMHNLQRKLSIDYVNLKFNGIAVSVHEINLPDTIFTWCKIDASF
jgi:hypothetical protein